jgi:hypothetical protein
VAFVESNNRFTRCGNSSPGKSAGVLPRNLHSEATCQSACNQTSRMPASGPQLLEELFALRLRDSSEGVRSKEQSWECRSWGIMLTTGAGCGQFPQVCPIFPGGRNIWTVLDKQRKDSASAACSSSSHFTAFFWRVISEGMICQKTIYDRFIFSPHASCLRMSWAASASAKIR